jgi:hypothetical protein
MNLGKKAMKILVIFMLSLTMTGGYAQAYPDLYNLGFQSRTTPSINDFLSSNLFLIFSNSHSGDFSSKADLPPFNYISKNEAIDIAKSLWPGAIWRGTPNTRLVGGIWTITLRGTESMSGGSDCECPEGYVCFGYPVGGIVKIDAKTGEIISVSGYK